MNAVGIIAEYNPFHNGHLYHLNETKKKTQADCVVAIISGGFTQRGKPGIDKWKRAEMAVRNGVDLVLELPFIFACNSAEFFAKGAIEMLDGLGCISHFSFGSESGDIDKLIHVAEYLSSEDEDFKKKLKEMLNKGMSYPRSLYETLAQLENCEMAEIISKPNNILAIEYLKQWIANNSKMTPVTVKRKVAFHHDLSLNKDIASATAIRNTVVEEKRIDKIKTVVPKETLEVIERVDIGDLFIQEKLFPLLVYKILTIDKNSLRQILTVGEGLENKIKKAIVNSKNIHEVIESIKSKRYTKTRIQRMLIHTLLDLNKKDFYSIMEQEIAYARILGISKKGTSLLNYIKRQNTNSIPILNNINKELLRDSPMWKVLNYDILASDICNFIRHGEIYGYSDHVHKPYLMF